MGEKNAFFKKVFLLSTKSITRETRLVSLVKQGNIMEGTQKRESNYYFLIKVLPKQCLKISQKSYFNFQSKGQRHLNFRSKKYQYNCKYFNNLIFVITIQLRQLWWFSDTVARTKLVWTILAAREQTSLFISQLLEDFWSANERRIIFQYLWWYPWVRVAEDKRSWKLLRFLLHFAFCCRLIIISRGILLIFYFSYE